MWTWHRAARREQRRRLSSRESSLHSPHMHTHQRRDEQRDAPRSVLQLPPRLSALQSLMPIANSTHRPPPSPHQPRAHAVRARTLSIAAHAGIPSICRNAALPLCSPQPRAATDAAVLEMGHNYSANNLRLHARGPVGDRERGGAGGVKPSALSRRTDPGHAGAGRRALCLDQLAHRRGSHPWTVAPARTPRRWGALRGCHLAKLGVHTGQGAHL